MKVKTIRSSWWEGYGYRLDCQPYLQGALETKIILEGLSVRKDMLQSLTKGHNGGIYHAGREARHWVASPEFGVPFLSSSDILTADLSSLPLISRRQVGENSLLRIHKGYTLITRSGTIGRIAYARHAMDGIACSEHVLRVIPDEEKILPGYLFAFTSSRYGIPLVVSGTYGSIIQSIEPEHIAGIPVPRFGPKLERKIHDLVEGAAELLTDSSKLVRKATQAFFESINLEDISAQDWNTHKDRDLGFRVDFPIPYSFRTLNFAPRFQALCKKIQAGAWKPFGEICRPGTLMRGGRYTRVDAAPEFSARLVGQKDLFNLRPEGRWVARNTIGDDLFLEAGTIAIAARGTLGESELYCRGEFIWGPWVNYAFSEDLLRVVADDTKMFRGCLFAFLRSETAFRMLRSISSGTKLQDNHYYFLPRLPIPMPKRAVQEKIHAMVVDAYEKRHLAVRMEDEAIAKVEAAIEKDREQWPRSSP